MTEGKLALAVVVVTIMVAAPILWPGGPSGNAVARGAGACAGGGRDAPGPREAAVNYMNKTPVNPQIDGTWGANEWTKAKRYDISVGGRDQCLVYISYDTTNTRIFMGIDVPVDVTQDANANENEAVQICIDGENDGRITYKNRDGTPENETGEVMPITYGGSCKDRWALITGVNTYNDAGWLNLNGADNSIQMWRTQPYYYEATDQMRAGFSGHRFYEYSIDYRYELGVSTGASTVIGIIIRVMDGLGDNNPNTWQARGYLPFNFSTLGGPWSQFSLTQAPLAFIKSPADGQAYYQNETVNFDGSASTDDAPSTLAYSWRFDDGGTAINQTAQHLFTTTGVHYINLTVTDADGLTNTTYSSVLIRERNVPPVISSFYPPFDPQVNETESIDFGVNVTDDNMDVGDRVNISWSVNGVFKRTDTNVWKSNFTVATQYEKDLSAGTYVIAASVVDSYDIDNHDPVVQSWTLTVQNTNRPPLVVSSSPDSETITMPENTAQDFSIEYIDLDDGDVVTVQWKLDNRTVPGSKDLLAVSYSPDFNSSGVHVLKAVMTDSLGGVTERTWTITVQNVNRAPRIVSATPSADAVQTQEGKTVLFVITAFDPDGGQPRVEWSINDEPVEGANGTAFSFRAQYEGARSADGSPYTLKASITDSGGLADERSWEVAVADVNRPPIAIVDEPGDGDTIRLGNTTVFDASRSWDPDSVDNSTLSFTWNFDDGSRAATVPKVSHLYAKPGNYTVRLTVRDRLTSSTVLLSLTVVAPVLSIDELSFDPPEGASAGKRVNINVRVANNGDAQATDVRLKLTMDNIALATLGIPAIERGEVQEVHYAWTAESGVHVLRAVLEPSASTVVGGSGNAQKEISVKARPGGPAPLVTGRTALMLAGAAAAGIMVAVGLAVWSRRRKARIAAGPAATAPAPASPAASQRVEAPQVITVPVPAQTVYPQFPGPAAPAPAVPPQTAGPAAQQAAPGPYAYPQFPAQAGPAPPPGAPAPAPTPTVQPQVAQVPPAPPIPPMAAAPAYQPPMAHPAAAPAPVALQPAAAQSRCPVCGEMVEAGWMVCPSCSTPLSPPAPPAAPAPPATPPAGAAPAPSTESTALASDLGNLIGLLGRKCDALAAAGKDVTHARGMLDISMSFLRTGKLEKAQQYLEKAQAAVSELES